MITTKYESQCNQNILLIFWFFFLESLNLVKSKQEKNLIIVKSIEDNNNITSLPVRLVIDATWLLDSDAVDLLNSVLKK